ncbi:transcriptional regulator with XRE-family HTH domain [Pseudomonas sp. JUb42]|jgi:transcriptional regulator with XRE-family HTH domain|uniref:helix-turn-helix domain-containing protein n=1 Tax=Pseudomonas sp. JUb42 TaxID=2940611 RepID=UPI00216A2D14|nr:cupin domain-containing protein [Pseudomonas sp. JUb42]MCS3468380.1 transcriptional regulator with XRE-family HTH domain [Pseudomonas sp. JUb42]
MDIDLDIARSQADYSEMTVDKPAIDIGARLNNLRRERKWTLVETSKHTGLSLSALSKIERNELSPTLMSLGKIASGFGIDVVTLLSDEDNPASLGRRSVNRHSHGLVSSTGTCENIWFAADLKHKRMLPLKTRVTAKVPGEYAEWPVHVGEIFVYVLSGRLVVHSQLYAPVYLEPGDSLYYDSSSGHKWTTEGETDAEVLWVYAG